MSWFKAYYRRNFLFVDLLLAVVIGIAFFASAELFWGRDEMREFLKGSRQATYTAIASTGGSLLGFVLTAVSIVLIIGSSPALQVVKDAGHLPTIYRIFFQTILWLAVATIWAFVGLLADTDTSPRALITYFMVFFFCLVGFRIYRCVWILREVTSLMCRPTQAS